MKKISLPVVVTVMCLMVSLVLGLFWINREKQSPIKTDTAEKITRTDYSDVARKTLDWIDKQRNDDSWYILERGCNFEEKTCDTVWDSEEGNKDGLIATWARFNYYQQTKDSADLEIVKSDINKFYEKYPEGVDNALWICKITYDMYASGLFDEEINNKLKDICFESELMDSDGLSDYWSKRSDRVFEAMKMEAVWNDWENYRLIGSFDGVLGIADDWLSRYLWINNDGYLKEAEDYLSLQNGLILSGEINEIDNICLTGLSYLDFFKKLNESKYLTRATEIYNEYVEQELDEILIKTPVCGLFSKTLFKSTGSDVFLRELESNNKILIRTGFDGDNVSVVNDGAFFTQVLTKPITLKSVETNALIVELLRD